MTAVWEGESEALRKAAMFLHEGMGGKFGTTYPGCFFRLRGVEDVTLEMVVTDGHRLVYQALPGEGSAGEHVDSWYVLPAELRKAVERGVRSVIRIDWTATGMFADERLLVSAQHWTRSSELFDVVDVRGSTERTLTVDRKALLAGLKALHKRARTLNQEEEAEAQHDVYRARTAYEVAAQIEYEAHERVKQARAAVKAAKGADRTPLERTKLKEQQMAAVKAWNPTRDALAVARSRRAGALQWRNRLRAQDPAVILREHYDQFRVTLLKAGADDQPFCTPTVSSDGKFPMAPTQMNLRYLLDAVKAAPGPTLTLVWRGDVLPLRLVVHEGQQMLLMPMRA